jgi:hypothetical protein
VNYQIFSTILNANVANNGVGRGLDSGDWLSQTDINNNPPLFTDCPIENSYWHGTHSYWNDGQS